MPHTGLRKVPTFKDLTLVLHIKIPDMDVNWKKMGDFCGFWKGFLENEAEKLSGA